MGLGLSQNQLLEKYGPYVRSLAAQVRKQFNGALDLEDLLAYGQVGLFEAAERFDPKVGANFLTFAHYRIKGAIYDGLRKMGILRGGDQRTSFVDERALAFLGNLSDREQGGGNRRGSIDDDVRDISDAVTGLAMVFATGMDAVEGGEADESLPPDQRIELMQLRQRVKAAIETLPETERKLLQGYYFQGRTLEEAGAELGLSKSWASRLHARAIEKLKEALAREEELPPVPSDRRQADGGSHGRRSGIGVANRPAEAAAGASPRTAEAGGIQVRRGSR